MRSRHTLLVVAIVIASVVVPGAAIAGSGPVADAQTQQPEVPEDSEVRNVTVTGLTTSFTMEEMTLTSSSANVTLQDAEVMIENASMSLESAMVEDASTPEEAERTALTVEGGELMVENATVTAATAEVEMNGMTMTLENETFTVENRTLTVEDRTFERMPGIRDSITVGPVTVDREMAQNALRNGTIESMTIDGFSGDMELDRASVEAVSWDEHTASGYVTDAQALVRNGSVTVENATVEDGRLVIENGSVHVQDGDLFITEWTVESDRDRFTRMNHVVGVEDRTFEFSDVELTPEEVLEMVFSNADRGAGGR